jgi:hypothetical protein
MGNVRACPAVHPALNATANEGGRGRRWGARGALAISRSIEKHPARRYRDHRDSGRPHRTVTADHPPDEIRQTLEVINGTR